MTILNVTVTAIERGNNHVTRVNLATPGNDCFVEITSYAPLNSVAVGQHYTLAIDDDHSRPQPARLHAEVGTWPNDHSEDLDPVKALGPRPC